jgi:hypothetical protein
MGNTTSNRKLAARIARGSRGKRGAHKNQHRVDKHPRRGRGRPKGSHNIFTREVKEAIIAAANELGEDGRGYDGMKGYLKHLGRTEPKTFGMLIRAVMPTQVTVEHKDLPPENYKDVQRTMEQLGLSPTLLEDLRTIKYHTPEQVLELTAEDVTADTDTDDDN